jgi:hypothetical protein
LLTFRLRKSVPNSKKISGHLARKKTKRRGFTYAQKATLDQMSPVRVGLNFFIRWPTA